MAGCALLRWGLGRATTPKIVQQFWQMWRRPRKLRCLVDVLFGECDLFSRAGVVLTSFREDESHSVMK